MEDEYEYNAPLDDTIPLDSPDSESGLLNLDFNTEVLDVCEAKNSGDEMVDYCEKEVVLDSDEEGGDENQVNLVNREPNSEIVCSPGGDVIGLLKRRKVQAGHFRRLDKKFTKHVLLQNDSANGDRSEDNDGGSTCLDNDGRFQEHLVIMDCLLSNSPDKKPPLTNAKEFLEEPECKNMVREIIIEDSLDDRKLSPHESNKSMDTGKDAGLSYAESQEPAESHSKALEFVEHYLSINDLGAYKAVESRNTKRIISPPVSKSNGPQRLASRATLGCAASKLMAYDWAEKQNGEAEYSSLRKNSTFEFEGDKSGYVSLNQVSDNANLKKEISCLQSNKKLPENILSSSDFVANSLNRNDIDKISETCIAYDSTKLDEQLNAGLSMGNTEEGAELRFTPDALDIGLDTQIAAEAMESLIQAVHPVFDACFPHQKSDNTLFDSPDAVNNKNKPKLLVNHEEAFVGWRCKGKRSKCVKISSVEEKNMPWLGGKLCKNEGGSARQLPVNKNLRKRKNINNTDLGRNSKYEVHSGIAVQQEQYGSKERDNLNELLRVQSLYGRRLKEIKSDSPPKERNVIQETGLKLSCTSSSEVKTNTLENPNPDLADRNPSMSNMWIIPKRKRARQYVVRSSIRSSSQFFTFGAIENTVEKHSIVNEKAENRGPKLLVYSRRSKSSLERKQIGSSSQFASDSSSPSVNGCALSDRKVQISIESDTVKPSEQCSDKTKQPCNHLSTSPLVKELTRLGYTESFPDFLPKNTRRRRAMQKVCILFSQNLETSILNQQRKIAARLGLSIASCCSNATHFVANRFVRTRNMLEAISLGKPIVTHLWLESCEQAGYVIDEKSYILRDERKEKEIGFNMVVSLTRARQHPLLKGLRVLVTPNVKPAKDMIHTLVKAVQGQALRSIINTYVKDNVIPDDVLILSCEEDYTVCLPFLEKGASVYDSELLLNGIVKQKLEYERYQLFRLMSNGS